MLKRFFSKNILIGLAFVLVACLSLVFIWVDEAPGKEEEIAVIVYEAGNGGWDSLQEGIKQAAGDFSVNTTFITLRADVSTAEQMEIIKREVNNGTKGILLAVDDSESVKQALQENALKVPILTVENGMRDSDIPCIAADNYAMGKRLAEEILADYSGKKNLKIVLNRDEIKKDSVAQRELGFMDTVGDRAQIILYDQWDQKDADVVVALHKTSLLSIVEDTETFPKSTKVYGIGGTAPIVAALDQGKVEKIVFQNEFNVGYLGTDMLIEQIRSKKKKELPRIDYYCVSRDELYGTQYEQLLFTIIE